MFQPVRIAARRQRERERERERELMAVITYNDNKDREWLDDDFVQGRRGLSWCDVIFDGV